MRIADGQSTIRSGSITADGASFFTLSPPAGGPCTESLVIPGRRTAASPETINTGLWNMGSGPAAARHPGMTGGDLARKAQKPPRPVRMFAPPEPIEAAWLLPDDPPFRFTWRRRAHRVRRADGPERIAEEWWTADGDLSPGAIRDYYRVEDDEGRRFWVFRAGL